MIKVRIWITICHDSTSELLLCITIKAWGASKNDIVHKRGCSPTNVDSFELLAQNIDWVMNSRRYDKNIYLIWEYELQSDNILHSNYSLSTAIDACGASQDIIICTKGLSPTNVDNSEHCTPNIDWVMNGRRYDKNISWIWEY